MNSHICYTHRRRNGGTISSTQQQKNAAAIYNRGACASLLFIIGKNIFSDHSSTYFRANIARGALIK